jgi:hypothetical protein
MRGGMYGVGEAITPGALTYGAAYTGPVNAAGNAIPDPTDPAGGYTGIGGRRRRRRGGNEKPPMDARPAPPPPMPEGPMDERPAPPLPPVPMPGPTQDTKGGRKTRKGKKSRKGGKKSRRKMRGGSAQISAMKAGYGFNGSGAGGLADAVPAPTSGGNPY